MFETACALHFAAAHRRVRYPHRIAVAVSPVLATGMTEPDVPLSNLPAPSRRRLPSPGCLLALLLLSLAALGGMFACRVHERQAAIRYFDELAANVDEQPANPVWLHDLVAARIGNDRATGFRELTRIELDQREITDAGLRHARCMRNLQSLSLSNTRISDAGLQHLSGLTRLKTLWLDGTLVTDDGLRHIAGLSSLETLILKGAPVTDAGVEHLSGLQHLRHLDLDDTQVADDGLLTLSRLTNLQRLHLRNSRITDNGLPHLYGLAGLKLLRIDGTGVTPAGVQTLDEHLSDCIIPRFLDTSDR
jgi:hypothetical protein